VAALVGSTCPAAAAAAGADSLAAGSPAAVGGDSLDVGKADRSRLAGYGIGAAVIADFGRSMRGLGGWEAGRRDWVAGIAVVAVVASALVVALGGGCGCAERMRGGVCRNRPLLAEGCL